MKKLKNILLTLLSMMITVSCSTVEKFTVYGNPGEKIYSPSKQLIATIQQNGNAKITLESDAYYGYLYTYNAQRGQWVPFALDITKKSHNGTKLASGVGYTLGSIGLLGTIGGMVGRMVDDESDAANAIMLGGAGLLGISASFGVPTSIRMGQLSYQYNFGYNSKQQVNTDLNLTRYTPPTVETSETTPVRKKATSGESLTANDSNTAKARNNTSTSSAKKKRKSASVLVAGEYSGTGTLITTGEDPETLGSVLMIVTPKDDNTVVVEIMEDNEAFFESEEVFKVMKNKDGSFTLKHTHIPSVKLTISKAGKINYKHPKVNIDGTIYTLSISADKSVK